jgi:hypothetical protein
MRHIPVITIAIAGIVHLLITRMHYAHAPIHGIFFALAGLAQCAWAVAFWRGPSLLLYRLGLGLSGGLVTLWLLTHTWGAPFGHGSEFIDLSTVICKASELTGLISLVVLAWMGYITFEHSSRFRRVSEALALSLLVGIGFFGLGKIVEPWLPQWGVHAAPADEHEDSGGEHSHDEEHNHAKERIP